MSKLNRRNFLRSSGLSVVPLLIPTIASAKNNNKKNLPTEGLIVKFFGDGDLVDTTTYIRQLQGINDKQPIERDFYGKGGAVTALEKKFEALTGKEKSIFMPSGTMANQLAISVLSGEKTKIFLQDTSHIYRDEADAAQAIFNKRLMPLAKGETYFTATVLKQAVESLRDEEVFTSGIGAVAIENPVRRSNGKQVPIEEIRKISEYCRSNNIKLHLDGARIYFAAAWSGISIREYASYFDTIYISLYKYLGASSGAILCGDASVINKMDHLMKIHGGTMFANWPNAAIALEKMEGVEEQFKKVIERTNELFAALNKLPAISITAFPGGTNIYTLQIGKNIDVNKFRELLSIDYRIRIPRADSDNFSLLMVNETILYRDLEYLISSFRNAAKKAHV